MHTPVWIPIRAFKGFANPFFLHEILSLLSSSNMSIAIETHAIASSSSPLELGSPKKTKIASPINLSIVPPHLIATLDIFVRYWVKSSVNTSGSNLSVNSVKPCKSEKKTVKGFRFVWTFTSSLPENIDS